MDLPSPRTLIALAALLVSLSFAATSLAAGGGVSPDGEQKGSSSSKGKLKGVPRSYAKFSDLVSGKTKLSLRVLGAWSLAEGGPKDNPLNIGPGQRYGTVGKGAKATSQTLKGELYRKVLASTDKSDGRQIKAIANSSWCPGCKGYGKLLRSTYRRVKVR